MGETGSKLKADQQDHSRGGKDIEQGNGRERGPDESGARERVRKISQKTGRSRPCRYLGRNTPAKCTGPRVAMSFEGSQSSDQSGEWGQEVECDRSWGQRCQQGPDHIGLTGH